jgi:hypothetical protein
MRVIRSLRFPAIAAVVVCFIVFLVSRVPVVYAQAVNTNPVPVATGCQVGTSSTQCIGSNPTRRSIQICNPSASITVWIAPGPTAAAANTGGSISIPPVSSGTTTCIVPPAGSGGGNTNVGSSWNSIAVTTPASLTVFEYF